MSLTEHCNARDLPTSGRLGRQDHLCLTGSEAESGVWEMWEWSENPGLLDSSRCSLSWLPESAFRPAQWSGSSMLLSTSLNSEPRRDPAEGHSVDGKSDMVFMDSESSWGKFFTRSQV